MTSWGSWQASLGGSAFYLKRNRLKLREFVGGYGLGGTGITEVLGK